MCHLRRFVDGYCICLSYCFSQKIILFIPVLLLCFICSTFCECEEATQTDAVGFPRLVWIARTAGKAISSGTVFEIFYSILKTCKP